MHFVLYYSLTLLHNVWAYVNHNLACTTVNFEF